MKRKDQRPSRYAGYFTIDGSLILAIKTNQVEQAAEEGDVVAGAWFPFHRK